MAPCFDCQQNFGGPDARMLSGPFLGTHGTSIYRCTRCGTEWNRAAPGAVESRWGVRTRAPVIKRDAGEPDLGPRN